MATSIEPVRAHLTDGVPWASSKTAVVEESSCPHDSARIPSKTGAPTIALPEKSAVGTSAAAANGPGGDAEVAV